MAKRKSTIGANPLDSLLGGEDRRNRSDREKKPERDKGEKRERLPHSERPDRSGGGKVRLTVHVPPDVSERAKDAVYWTPGLTLADLAETALRRELDRIEEERGEPFPKRTSELRGGRPLKR